MSGQPAVLQVVILRDGLLVGTEVFVPGSYTLGSAPTSDLRLEDPSVGASHATLYFQNGRAAVQDLNSRTGTFVNGHKVSTCEIRAVDELACGPFVLKTRVLAQKPAAKTPPPEVAALLGNQQPPARGGAPHPVAAPVVRGDGGTAISARRMSGAAPAEVAEAAPRGSAAPAARPQHLRPVPPPRPTDENFAIVPPTSPVELPPGGLTDAGLFDEPSTTAERPGAKARTGKKPRLRLPSGEGKGAPRLFFELYWGETRQQARSFTAKQTQNAKKPLRADASDSAAMPLWGFSVPEGGMTLAEGSAGTFRVFIPPKAAVEQLKGDGFYPTPEKDLQSGAGGKYLSLSNGMAARLSEGDMTLVAYVAPPQRKPWVNPLRGLPWLALAMLLLFGSVGGVFLYYSPKRQDSADFQAKNLNPVAVRLIAPEPKKKEEAAKKLKALKEAAVDKTVKKAPKESVEAKKVEKAIAKAAPAEAKALKALSKLSAAGPAMGDILAAVDKLGSGPGSKNAKSSNFKLSGLVGKAPIANAGLGTFGLGGGGKGGGATLGGELLRGKGGGGIGAFGAGGIGKGSVGGTVTRASARSVAVQGNIDREAVAKTVNSHLQEVRGCYERALLKDPGLAGKVVLEWTISTAGRVVTAKTKTSSLRNSAVEGCILQNLKTWQFPAARGGVVIVSYPFLFNSVGY